MLGVNAPSIRAGVVNDTSVHHPLVAFWDSHVPIEITLTILTKNGFRFIVVGDINYSFETVFETVLKIQLFSDRPDVIQVFADVFQVSNELFKRRHIL